MLLLLLYIKQSFVDLSEQVQMEKTSQSSNIAGLDGISMWMINNTVPMMQLNWVFINITNLQGLSWGKSLDTVQWDCVECTMSHQFMGILGREGMRKSYWTDISDTCKKKTEEIKKQSYSSLIMEVTKGKCEIELDPTYSVLLKNAHEDAVFFWVVCMCVGAREK